LIGTALKGRADCAIWKIVHIKRAEAGAAGIFLVLSVHSPVTLSCLHARCLLLIRQYIREEQKRGTTVFDKKRKENAGMTS
jgi:hypothetical protein